MINISTPKHSRPIVDIAFGRRLTQFVDSHPLAPPLHRGRLLWLQEMYKGATGETVSGETVRKWFAGESRPRPVKMTQLAQALQVDEAWLALGVEHRVSLKEKKARNALADGAVNLIAGLIQMDGGAVSFPEHTDRIDADANIDLRAIIKGASYAFNVSVGEIEGEEIAFNIPSDSADFIVLGVVRTTPMSFEVFEISDINLDERVTRQGGSLRLSSTLDKLRKIVDFTARL